MVVYCVTNRLLAITNINGNNSSLYYIIARREGEMAERTESISMDLSIVKHIWEVFVMVE